MKKWRIEDSEDLYNINGWGASYFSINEKGHVAVTPKKDSVQVEEYHFNGNREKVREQTVVQALDLLRRSVLSHYKKD